MTDYIASISEPYNVIFNYILIIQRDEYRGKTRINNNTQDCPSSSWSSCRYSRKGEEEVKSSREFVSDRGERTKGERRKKDVCVMTNNRLMPLNGKTVASITRPHSNVH